jgi:hypothetical protein
MKFLDPQHRKRGYTTLDFTRINLKGWIVRNDPAYTFLLPTTRRTKPAQEPEPWTKIEAILSMGKSKLAKSQERNLGCLLDIQSFVHTGEYLGVDLPCLKRNVKFQVLHV